MSDLRKAAEMALEVMEYNRANGTPNMGAAIEALRQALAMEKFSEVNQEIEEALKQPKREWVGLTKEEIDEIGTAQPGYTRNIYKAIEVKLKEKNT